MTSPTIDTLTFEEAIVKLRDGQKIIRTEWNNNGVFRQGVVMLHRADRKLLLIDHNDGDLLAEDWLIVHNN